MANYSDVGVFAAGGEIFAVRDREDVKQGRKNTLVKCEQGGGCAFPP
jgi:hypothetical protein